MSNVDAPRVAPEGGIPLLTSIGPLAKNYDAWLCDIWGVLHNGIDTFDSACEACIKYREAGGVVVLISNAPRPKNPVIEQFTAIGVPGDAWDEVITSGDVTRTLLSQWLNISPSRRIFHLGPERDRSLFTGIEVEFAEIDAADLIVNTGLFDDTTETPDDYSDLFSTFKQRALKMICANPDIKVERGNKVIYCAGALAEAYAERGGEVTFAGKPHLPIYERAFDLMAEVRGESVPKSRILAIGDNVKTDITGAAAAGIDALFVPSAIHVDRERGLDSAMLAEIFDGMVPPVAAQTALKW